jgi:ABC-2 type transport system ATP-binding protein
MSLNETAIELRNLTKNYTLRGGVKTALSDVSLSIPKGSVFGILGPNGAGKSTIINIISGILKKTSGEIFVSGKDASLDLNFAKMQIGTAIQEVVLDPFFTVLQYLTFTAGYYGITGLNAKQRIEEVCNRLQLIEHLQKNTRMLSGGMKRRLIIAKALIHNPEIIILDEPTAGVDIELRASLWKYMQDLNREGKTIILTTHYLQEAQDFCDRIAFINNGKIILEDNKDNILKLLNSKKILFLLKNDLPNFDLPSNCVLTKKNVPGGMELELIYNPLSFKLEDFLQKLYDAKAQVKDITSVEASLDDIFISIFKKNKL